MVNFSSQKESPQDEEISGPGRQGIQWALNLQPFLTTWKNVFAIGSFVFKFNIFTFTSRAHLILFSNLICLWEDGTPKFKGLRNDPLKFRGGVSETLFLRVTP